MNYAVIKKFDIANGPGVRVSLFVSGCRHCCENCFNSEAWDFNFGKPFTDDVINDLVNWVSPDYITGFSVLGGEPFEPENQNGVLKTVKLVKTKMPNKNVWVYTGFLFEQLLEVKAGNPETIIEILKFTDVLVDGKYVEKLKSPDLIFRGSSNQRIIDVQKSLSLGKTCLLEGKWERKMGNGNIYEQENFNG